MIRNTAQPAECSDTSEVPSVGLAGKPPDRRETPIACLFLPGPAPLPNLTRRSRNVVWWTELHAQVLWLTKHTLLTWEERTICLENLHQLKINTAKRWSSTFWSHPCKTEHAGLRLTEFGLLSGYLTVLLECGKGHSEDLSALYPGATQNSILWCTCEILKKPHKSLEATGCGKWSTAMQLMITQTMGTHRGEERRHSFSRWVVNESGNLMFGRALREGLLKEGHGLSQPWPATSKLSVFSLLLTSHCLRALNIHQYLTWIASCSQKIRGHRWKSAKDFWKLWSGIYAVI